MKIFEFIDMYSNWDNFPSIDNLKKWWSKDCDGYWRDIDVNFYTLLCNCPLWKFNEFYNKWYKVKDSNYEGGPMGDFLEDEPTIEQIEEYMHTGNITF